MKALGGENGVRSGVGCVGDPDRLGGHRLGGGGPQRDGAAKEASVSVLVVVGVFCLGVMSGVFVMAAVVAGRDE